MFKIEMLNDEVNFTMLILVFFSYIFENRLISLTKH